MLNVIVCLAAKVGCYNLTLLEQAHEPTPFSQIDHSEILRYIAYQHTLSIHAYTHQHTS